MMALHGSEKRVSDRATKGTSSRVAKLHMQCGADAADGDDSGRHLVLTGIAVQDGRRHDDDGSLRRSRSGCPSQRPRVDQFCHALPQATPRRSCREPPARCNRGGDLLGRTVAVHRVDEPAAVVDQRLEDLLDRGVIWRCGVPEMQADDREPLTGRRNGPLNQLAARLLECSQEIRRERQRSASGQKLQQITLSASLTMIELPVIAGCAHTADDAIWYRRTS